MLPSLASFLEGRVVCIGESAEVRRNHSELASPSESPAGASEATTVFMSLSEAQELNLRVLGETA